METRMMQYLLQLKLWYGALIKSNTVAQLLVPVSGLHGVLCVILKLEPFDG